MTRLFDGIDDEVDCGDNAQIANVMAGGGTSFIWAFPTGIGTSTVPRLMDKREGSNGIIFMYIDSLVSNAFRIITWQDTSASTGQWITSTRPVNEDQWNRVGMTYDSDSVANDPTHWCNGVTVANFENITPTGTADDDTTKNLGIGDIAVIPANARFEGHLGYSYLWSEILTDNMMEALMRGVHPWAMRRQACVFGMDVHGNKAPESDLGGQQVSLGVPSGTTKSVIGPPVELLENYL